LGGERKKRNNSFNAKRGGGSKGGCPGIQEERKGSPNGGRVQQPCGRLGLGRGNGEVERKRFKKKNPGGGKKKKKTWKGGHGETRGGGGGGGELKKKEQKGFGGTRVKKESKRPRAANRWSQKVKKKER